MNQISNQIQVSSWESPSGGLLVAEYDEYEKKAGERRHKLKSIKFTKYLWCSKVDRSNIRINDMPAEYLKSFTLSRMPSEEGKLEELKSKDGYKFYKLTFDTNPWGWWYPRCDVLNILIFKESDKDTDRDRKPDRIPSCLKVLGLKKFIQNKFNDQLYHFKQYLIFYNGNELGDEYTLGEIGIKENDEITFLCEKPAAKKSTALQAGQGAVEPFEYFQRFAKSVTDDIGPLVCFIKLSGSSGRTFVTGTGFLIGEDLIITNAHVLKEDCSGSATATFFYQTEIKEYQPEKKEIVVNLILKPISYSANPGENQQPTNKKLDFTILQFTPGLEKEIAQKATSFFLRLAEEPKPSYKHANIIGHPQGNVKQIAFRESRIYGDGDAAQDYFEIHYETTTQSGSSGSPVISDEGQLIGLHYSICTLIERRLTKYKRRLFKKLDLEKYDNTNPQAYFNFEKFPELKVHRKGVNKGRCRAGDEEFSLLELIKRKTSCDTPRAWAVNFLKEQGEKDLKEHINCNIAIRIGAIVNNIKKEFPQDVFESPLKAENFLKVQQNVKRTGEDDSETDESKGDESRIANLWDNVRDNGWILVAVVAAAALFAPVCIKLARR